MQVSLYLTDLGFNGRPTNHKLQSVHLSDGNDIDSIDSSEDVIYFVPIPWFSPRNEQALITEEGGWIVAKNS